MSYYAELDNGVGAPLASIGGMQDLREWVDAIPADEDLMYLRSFLEDGISTSLDMLEGDTAKALVRKPSSDIADTLVGLLKLLDRRKGADCLTLTDEISDGDDAPDYTNFD